MPAGKKILVPRIQTTLSQRDQGDLKEILEAYEITRENAVQIYCILKKEIDEEMDYSNESDESYYETE